ncbi:MAG: hypothetical protein OQJ76_04970, partial [Rhodospirillales bacterium]|nr:hypothetical protein [Rhodospirillales bacterium]
RQLAIKAFHAERQEKHAMTINPSPFRSVDGVTYIDIRLSRIQQLFNSFDPAPFNEKDIDKDAEAYIVGSMRELPPSTNVRLAIHLPPDQAEETARMEPGEAIRNYFSYRLWVERESLREVLRNGWISLAIGLIFLIFCITVREIILSLQPEPSMLIEVIAEGALISGWVAMWRPIQTFLYDWRPIRRRCAILERLAAIDVDIMAESRPGPF